MLFAIFTMGNRFYDILFAFLDNKDLPKRSNDKNVLKIKIIFAAAIKDTKSIILQKMA